MHREKLDEFKSWYTCNVGPRYLLEGGAGSLLSFLKRLPEEFKQVLAEFLGGIFDDKRCGTCRFWNRYKKLSNTWGVGTGWCGEMDHSDGYIYGGLKESDKCQAMVRSWADDDTGLGSELITTEEFGCALHKRKE